MQSNHVTFKRLKQYCQERGLPYMTVWRAHSSGQLPPGLIVRIEGSRSLFVNEGKFDKHLDTGAAA